MNYRHAFHAGNCADVLKHALLVALLEHLARKDTPYCVLDTHAGRGRYDLAGAAARRSSEWPGGIGRLWDVAAARLPPVLARYVAIVRGLNPDGALRWYPGSPLVACACLRAQDRLVLCEMQPDEHAALRQEMAAWSRAQVHRRDAWEAMKALLPPAERRGLVLVDPPYEQPDEAERARQALERAVARWPSGVYALWYPVKDPQALDALLDPLRAGGLRKILRVEQVLYPPEHAHGLRGSGLLVVNPPWQFDDAARAILAALDTLLAAPEHAPRSTVEWLVPE